jgi:hypothetical protein
MKKSRAAILISLTVAIAIALLAAVFIASSAPDDAITPLIVIFVGLWLSLMFIVSFFLQVPYQRMNDLREALRSLSLGARDNRLNPDRFGELSEIASAFNEVVGALAAGHDPNLGPVVSEKRKNPARAPAQWTAEAHSHHPEIGDVRPLPQEAPPAEEIDAKAAAAMKGIGENRALPATSKKPTVETTDPKDAPGPGKKTNQSAPAKDSKKSSLKQETVESNGQSSLKGPAKIVDSKNTVTHAAQTVPSRQADTKQNDRHATTQQHEPSAPHSADEESAGEKSAGEKSAGEKSAEEKSAGDKSTAVPGRSRIATNPALPKNVVKIQANRDPSEQSQDNDTAIDGLLKTDNDKKSNPLANKAGGLSGIRVSPDQPDGLKELFDCYVKTMKEHNQPIDGLTFKPFALMIESERDRLLAEPGCQEVRFEIKYQDGEVSLQPRVVRLSQIPQFTA